MPFGGGERNGEKKPALNIVVFMGAYHLKARCSEFCYFALKEHSTVGKGFIMIFIFSIEETLACNECG